MTGDEAILLVAHGTVDRLDDLPAFLANIRRGHAAPPELAIEMRRRYEAIGGKSPLTEISERLARKVEALTGLPTRLAMRLWHPYPEDVLRDLALRGARRVRVVPLAQHSAHVYAAAARDAAAHAKLELACAPNWGCEPKLVAAFARAILAELAALGERAARARIVMTAHSLPTSVLDAGDRYEHEVRASADAVFAHVKSQHPALAPYALAFQSQGVATSMQWLGPTLRATLEALVAAGARDVILAPIGFLADHIEILYDLDIEARAWCAELGLAMRRTASLNDDDALAAAIGDVAARLAP